MKSHVKWALSGAAIAALAACGGDGGSPVAVAPASSTVALTVMDGLIQGATVCLDVNGNSSCDASEPQGTSGADGKVSFSVPNTDLGKYPVVAVVGPGAIDMDDPSTPITAATAYTLTAPADQTAVVSPLTTLVQLLVASQGLSTTAAAAAVQSQAGLSNSPMANYVATPDSQAANAARVLVAAIQSQTSTLATPSLTKAEIQKAILDNASNLLAAAVLAGSDDAVVTACAVKTSDACKTAIANAVATVVADAGLTPTTVAAAVELAKAPAVTESATPVASFALDWVNAGDSSNWYTRIFTSTAAENTPDANGLVRYRSIRHARVAGVDTEWVRSNDPTRAGDLHWSGSAWVGCTIGFQNTSTVRDAQGRSSYNFCDSSEKGSSQRVTTSIEGKTMADVFALIQATRTGGSNWGKAPTWFTGTVTASVGSATFPADSKLQVQNSVTTEVAIAYDVQSDNIVTVADADVAAGGDAVANSGVACNTAQANNASQAVTLETVIARNPGTPCSYAAGTLTGLNGQTFSSLTPNTAWGNTTTSMGNLGSAALGTSSTATGYYTGNKRLRVSFAGGSSNAVTFYTCLQRSINGSTRNCTTVGTGTYTITTLGDARVMTFSALPAAFAALTYDRVFVERAGQVYWGYKDKLSSYKVVRLNGTAGNAVLSQLGLPTFTP
ncbi:hypothetical protein SAMN05216303_102740 [Rhodoferax sp. OV413]|uniref:hypothetical protein n=1 Tax=Rhodoferax sp. OV413 TaxID=1855285 RepID=UPI00088B17D1|nr:hypothetical protein [Rhodoferax sp. OV413]SDO93883.1 hypothetical protein SAMN05216303_102740 [Rhodoferax sp. OV413]